VGTPDALGPWLGRVMITKTPPQSPLMTRHRDTGSDTGEKNPIRKGEDGSGCINRSMTRWWQLKYFYVHPENSPKIGEDEPMLTHIFEMGWFNHQPDDFPMISRQATGLLGIF